MHFEHEMTKPLLLASLVFLATPVLAQEVPDDVARDLWCGLAFEFAVAEAPSDDRVDNAMLTRLSAGAELLIGRATASLYELGFTEESLAAHRDAVGSDVRTQMNSPAKDEAYSFEDCNALTG
jgi:hypothetical protein